MKRKCLRFIYFLLVTNALAAETTWYRSNPAGMALEPAAQFVAQRSEYSLCISLLADNGAAALPQALTSYKNPAWQRLEKRQLYHKGVLDKVQWRALDAAGNTLFSAVLGSGDKNLLSFSVYNNDGTPAKEASFDTNGTETATAFTFSNLLLLNSTLSVGGKEYARDTYRYTRSGSLRSVERTYASPPQGGQKSTSIYFPALKPHLELQDDFIEMAAPVVSAFLQGAQKQASPARTVFVNDNDGHVVKITDYDSKGKIIAVTENIWDKNRVSSVSYTPYDADGKAGNVSRVEYSYDADGNRIAEKDYRNNVLERTMTTDAKDSTKQTEEIYMKGKLILRAWYQDGRKIKEKMLR